MKFDPEYVKIAIVGDIGVGKRSLLTSYGAKPRASPLYLPIENHEIKITGNQKKWKALCFDSLLLEEDIPVKDDKLARKLMSTVMNGVNAVLLCYSRDNIDSFHNLSRWYKAVSLYFSTSTLVFLVETKDDKPIKVKENDVAEFVKNNHITKHFAVQKDKTKVINEMFTSIAIEIEKAIEQINKQLQNYSSPSKLGGSAAGKSSNRSGGSKTSVLYNDKKEKVVLVDGSYTKIPGMQEEKEAKQERNLGKKHLDDDDVFLEVLDLKKK